MFLAVAILLSTGTTAYGGLVILGFILISGAFVFKKLRTPAFKSVLASGMAIIPAGFVLDPILFSGTLRGLLWYEIQKLTFSAGSGNIRLQYMTRTLDVIEARPLLGVGVGSHHVPSLLLTLAAEAGLVGLAIFIALHLTLYHRCGWLASRGQAPYDALALPLFIGGTTLILTNLVAKSVATLLYPWYWFSLAFPLALIGIWKSEQMKGNADVREQIGPN